MLKLTTITFTIAILFFGTNAMCEDSSEKKMALTSANEWLMDIDNKKYPESWTNAATVFKNAITSSQWVQSVSTARELFGQLVWRSVAKQDYYTSLPGAPDGNYYVIQYTSKFENKAKAIETVTTVKDQDGVWNVSGYFIK